MILATGAIGGYVVQQRAARGAPFQALVRDRSKGERLGCPFVVGDFTEPATLGPALAELSA
jgi:uncharacterized protein YbjT (DUF2867 family)